jgi:hypothetical protein
MEQLIQQLLAAIVQQAVPHVVAAATNALPGHQGATAASVMGQAAPTPAAQPNTLFAAQPAVVAAPAAAGGMFGNTPTVAAAPAVTPDIVQALITPMVQNEQVKAALTAQMHAMGIQNLPDTKPEQLAELYQRFQHVDREARAAGLIGGVAPAAPSII